MLNSGNDNQRHRHLIYIKSNQMNGSGREGNFGKTLHSKERYDVKRLELLTDPK